MIRMQFQNGGSEVVDTKRLEMFRRVVDLASFQLAAESLSISQSALSQRISRMERDLGVKLLDRSRRPVRMTHVGRQIYAYSREFDEAERKLDMIIQRAQQGRHGTVRLGLVPSLMSSFLPSVIAEFRNAFRDIEIELTYAATVDLREHLEDGRIDVAGLYTAAQDNHLARSFLFRDPYVAVINRGNPLSEASTIQFQDFKNETLIMIPREAAPENYDAIIGACLAQGFSPRAITAPGSYLLHMGLVSAGLGISFCPSSSANLTASNIVSRAVTRPDVAVEVALSHYPARGNAAVTTLISFLQESCATQKAPQVRATADHPP